MHFLRHGQLVLFLYTIFSICLSNRAYSEVDEASLVKSLETAGSYYREGRFQQSIEVYSKVIEQNHVNGSLFFNLGNSYYKLGQKGDALAAYFQAHQLLPRNPDILANINFILRQNKNAAEWKWSGPAWIEVLSFYGKLSQTEILYLAAIFLGVTGLLIGFWFFNWGRNAVHVFALTTTLLIGLYFSVLSFLTPSIWPKWGAVRIIESEVLSSPSDKSGLVVFRLAEGTPVMIREVRSGWVKIRLSDDKEGWLMRDQVAFFDLGSGAQGKLIPRFQTSLKNELN